MLFSCHCAIFVARKCGNLNCVIDNGLTRLNTVGFPGLAEPADIWKTNLYKNNMNKRTIFTFLFLLVALFAVAQEYTISCAVKPEFNGKTAYIVNKNAGDTIAACEIVDNAFMYKGEICSQAVIDVVVNRPKGMVASVLIEGGSDVVVDMTVRPVKINDNGGLNDKLNAMYAAVKERSVALSGLAKKLHEEGKSEEEILAATTAETEALYDVYRNTITENRDNILGAFVLNLVARQFYSSVEALDAVMADVKYSGEFRALKKIRTALYYGGLTKAGNKFIDFAGFAIDDAAVRLSDYVGKGKYVLVDFWASWCGPCKNEMPHIIEVNRQYTGERFMVIGVNIGDENGKFKAAVAELGIDYPQIFIPRNSKDEDNAALLYNVETIPHLILFAPDGTIKERGIPGSALHEKLDEYLK